MKTIRELCLHETTRALQELCELETDLARAKGQVQRMQDALEHGAEFGDIGLPFFPVERTETLRRRFTRFDALITAGYFTTDNKS